MIKYFIFFIVLFCFSAQSLAQEKPLKIELAYEQVDITTGFNGAKVVLFGTTTLPGKDIVITLKGPEKTVIVRRKNRAMGAWVNTNSIEFRRVPSYYDYASNREDLDLWDIALLNEHAIGVEHLGFYSEDGETPESIDLFREALIRSMQHKGFYPLKSHPLPFVDPTLFKVAFDLPPGVPTGLYTVDAVLIDEGKTVFKESKRFQVGQVGFNAKVYLFANQSAFWYGIFTVLIAAITGWGAFTFLRRD